MLATHDAGDGFRAVLIRDHHHGRIERIGLAIQREDGFAGLGPPHHEGALHLCRVKHVQGPATIEGDVIGDIDQRVDRTEADGAQALLHPFRRRAVLDAAHEAQRESRAKLAILAGEIQRHRNRARPLATNGGDCGFLQLAKASRREIPCDAPMPVASGRFGVRLISITGSAMPAQSA